MNTEEIMKLADAYAAAETSFWFGQEQANSTVDTDARRSRNQARAALEAALSAKQADAAIDNAMKGQK